MSEKNQEQNLSDDERAKDALWKNRIEIVTTVIMAITAITIAWSSYQAALWGGEQSTNYSQASSKRVESVRSSLTGYQAVTIDLILFTDWIDAISTDNQDKADFLFARMRDEMRKRMPACGVDDYECDYIDSAARPGEMGYGYSRSSLFRNYKTGSEDG